MSEGTTIEAAKMEATKRYDAKEHGRMRAWRNSAF
jgi:hypothetical protein